MSEGSYKQFCPVAMASEILCTRWTMMLLRELLLGTSRFNDLRRGLPRMSPALLSRRLKDLESAGILKRTKPAKGSDLHEYALTDAGLALKPIVDAVGDWGHRWVTTKATLAHLDVNLLMWNMRRKINPKPLPQRRSTIQIIYRVRVIGGTLTPETDGSTDEAAWFTRAELNGIQIVGLVEAGLRILDGG